MKLSPEMIAIKGGTDLWKWILLLKPHSLSYSQARNMETWKACLKIQGSYPPWNWHSTWFLLETTIFRGELLVLGSVNPITHWISLRAGARLHSLHGPGHGSRDQKFLIQSWPCYLTVQKDVEVEVMYSKNWWLHIPSQSLVTRRLQRAFLYEFAPVLSCTDMHISALWAPVYHQCQLDMVKAMAPCFFTTGEPRI